MRAEATRAGGRHLLRERDGYGAPIAVESYQPTATRGPLVERLSGESLAALAKLCGMTVEALVSRYART